MSRWVTTVVLVVAATFTTFASGGTVGIALEIVLVPVAVGVLAGVLLAAGDRTSEEQEATVTAAPAVGRQHASMAGRVRAAARSRHGLMVDLLPELRPVVDDHLRHHGTTLDTTRARELLGDDLHDLMTATRDPRHDRDRAGLPVAELLSLLERLERTA